MTETTQEEEFGWNFKLVRDFLVKFYKPVLDILMKGISILH